MASTVWRGYISFGLITIPVRLFRAARPERVGLRRLYRAERAPEPEADIDEEPSPRPLTKSIFQQTRPGPSQSPIAARVEETPQPYVAPVQQVSVRKGFDEPLAAQSIVKGYEYEKDRYVVLEPDELKSLAPKTSSGMEIQEFVALLDIDPVYFETSYYVSPEEAGQKAYALLYRSMQTTGLVAIAQFAMHTREHVVVLRPGKKGLLAHTMFFVSEVRADEEYIADARVVAEKELTLAETLIRSLAAPFEPEKYRDSYKERLESMIAQKVKGQPVAVSTPAPKPAEVVDIAEALRRSLANLKKPVKSEAAAQEEKGAVQTKPKRAARGNSGR
ncbi:MAG: Ku protein [Acidobacteriaceae bacterium]|nr:Ku protein [Acidobacteriaceae bacterium]